MSYPFALHRVNLFLISMFLLFSSMSCGQDVLKNNISTGADELVHSNINLLMNKRIGIITNKTGRLSNGTMLVDSLNNIPGIKVQAIFSPEHGFFINKNNGKNVNNSYYRDIKVFSLYGKSKVITSKQLQNINILIFDIQDIGARFYTYISTLYYAIKSAAENNVEIIVLDRPNPLGGKYIDGPVLESEYLSFIGIAPLPIVHGMTIGELSKYFNDLIFAKIQKQADLTIIKMQNWKRERPTTFFKHKWINTSPNIPNYETALIYPGTCFLEGTNVSEGRGTESPFLLIGAPFINSSKLIGELNNLNCKFLSFKDTTFKPKSIHGMAMKPKYENKLCYGIKIKITDERKIEPVKFGIKLLYALHKLYPNQFKFKNNWIDKLIGTNKVREMIISNKNPGQIIEKWEKELTNFKKVREKYLLY